MITLSELISTAEKSPYNLAELQALVIDWAKPKEIKKEAQELKIIEEYGEMIAAILKIEKKGIIDVIDGIGDTLVTLIIQSDLTDTQLFADISIADTRESNINTLHSKFIANYSKGYYKTCGELIESIAHLYGLNPIDCLYSAYRIISKRKGQSINGTFIKESETEPVTAEIQNELPAPEID